MDTATMIDVILTIQHMEERGIFVKDHTIEDAIGLVEFNRIVDNEIMMTKKLEEIDMKKYDEEYLNSKIEAYGKTHPNGNKEDLALLAEMRGYGMEE